MNELFEGIEKQDKKGILKVLKVNGINFSKNTNILHYINVKNYICIVNTGEIDLIKIDYEGNKKKIKTLTSGDLFGNIFHYLKSNDYQIITKTNSYISILDYDFIISNHINSKYYTIFLQNLLKIMKNTIEELNEKLEIISEKSTRDKLLSYFQINATKSNTRIVYLKNNFTDLATYLNINRSHLMREIKYLKEEGFIEVKGKIIKLLY